MKHPAKSVAVSACAVVCALALGAALAPAPAAADPDSFVMPEGAEYEPETALVMVSAGTDADAISEALLDMDCVEGVDATEGEVASGLVRVELSEGVSVEDAVNELRAQGVVADAQPNYRYVLMDEAPALEAAAATNDPQLSSQWGLSHIGALRAWDLARCDRTVTIASLDLGVDVSHPDLKDNVVAPYNAHNAVSGGSTSDVTPIGGSNYIHGTHVAGILSAVSGNGVGVSGVSYNARVMPIKVVDNAGNAYTRDLVKAYDYLLANAAAYNVRVVNISMGSAGDIPSDDAFLRKIDEAYSRGIVTVAAAGNRNTSLGWNPPYECYPGDYDKVVSVINLRQSGSGVTRADGSNYNGSGERDKNISAPGSSIYSTTPGGAYGLNTGTSMAAPFVSAVLALEFAANPSLSASQAVSILYETATDIGASGWDATYGYGEVNAYGAVERAKGTSSPSKWSRLAGANRYDTMAAVVGAGFKTSGYAVVATGANFPDALAASALAGARQCPVILTDGGSLSAQARGKLQALGVKSAYVMGGTGTVSSSVESAIRNMGISVSRVYGADRMATSVAAFKTLRGVNASSNTVIIATGSNFADSLSIGPWAYATYSPIVLTKGDGTLSSEAVATIKADKGIRRVVVMGGAAVVSDEVKAQLGSGYTYLRLAGANRYATSMAAAAWATTQGLAWSTPAVATGANFPDALTGAALCGRSKSPILLAGSPSSETIALLKANKAGVKSGFLLGGESAVSPSLAAAVDAATR